MHWLKRVKNVKFLLYPVFLHWIFLLLPLSSSGQESSVLASGNWLKLGVMQSGVYKIDAALLKEMGVDITSIAACYPLDISLMAKSVANGPDAPDPEKWRLHRSRPRPHPG